MFDSVGSTYRCNADVACMRVRGVVWTACFVREDETRSRGKGEGTISGWLTPLSAAAGNSLIKRERDGRARDPSSRADGQDEGQAHAVSQRVQQRPRACDPTRLRPDCDDCTLSPVTSLQSRRRLTAAGPSPAHRLRVWHQHAVASGPCARRRALGQRCKAPWRSSTRGPPASRHGALAALHLVVYKTLCAHGYTLRFCRRGEATGCTHCAAPTLRSMVIDRPSSWIAKGARTRTTWNVKKQISKSSCFH